MLRQKRNSLFHLAILLAIAAFLICGVSTVSTLFAQATGTISGFVTDPTGAAIQQATVTATLVRQNISRAVESNAEGFYIFNAMPPGSYRVTAEVPGFQRLVREGLALTVNQRLRVDLSMSLGELTEVVEVTAAAPLVNTTSGAVSGLVDGRQVVDLPINGRNVIALAKTIAGVADVRAPQALTDARSGALLNVNGGFSTMNLFTFNGANFVNASRNTGLNYPPPDAVQEFRIQTHGFSAEYGRNAGSQVNVVSKSGTNEFHGSLFEFFRNDNLNARNFFAPRTPALVQNQFGAAAGGPIVRDRLFVFASWQSLRDRPEAVAEQARVPTAAQRNGDFRDLLPGTVLRNPVDPLTGAPFTDSQGNPCVIGNVISPDCFSPAIVNSFLPLVPESPSGTFTTLAPSRQDVDQAMVRTDWRLNDKHTIYGTYFIDHNERDRPALASGNIPNYQSRLDVAETNNATLSSISTFSPTVLNEFLVSFVRSTSERNISPTIAPTELGINMPQYPDGGAVGVSVSGAFSFGSGGRVVFTNNNWQVRNSTSWITENHNIKFGGEWLHQHFRQIFLGTPGFTFNGSRTGNPIADFLLGSFRTLSTGFGVRQNDDFMDAFSLFVQDEFKVTPRLTLSMGVRYEPFLPWVDRFDRLLSPAGFFTGEQSTRFPDAPPGILFAGDPGVPRSVVQNDLNNFAPRFGFAWDVLGDGRTAIRGSYGIFYDHIKADAVAQENPPFAGSVQIFDGIIDDPFGSVGREPPPVAPGGEDFDQFPLPFRFRGIDHQLRTPYVQAWNLNIQRQLTSSVMIESAYIGKIGQKLEVARNFNPAAPIPDPITGEPPSLQNVDSRVIILPGILNPRSDLIGNDNRSWYHGWQSQLSVRDVKGLTLTTSYTLSKSIDLNSSNVFSNLFHNPFNLSANRGRSDFDRRHNVIASWLWVLPVNFSEGWQRTVLGGWSLSGIHNFRSGAPFSILMGDDVALDGTGNDQLAQLRPDHGPIAIDHGNRGEMVARFFNTDAFVPTDEVPRGTYGNVGRNILSGPAFFNTDFAVLKDFRFQDRYSVQFRAEFFNFFNQVNFDNPEAEVNSSTFGQIRGAGSARVVQFALKFLW